MYMDLIRPKKEMYLRHVQVFRRHLDSVTRNLQTIFHNKIMSPASQRSRERETGNGNKITPETELHTVLSYFAKRGA